MIPAPRFPSGTVSASPASRASTAPDVMTVLASVRVLGKIVSNCQTNTTTRNATTPHTSTPARVRSRATSSGVRRVSARAT